MCLECGFYKDRQVIDLTAKKEAREVRLHAKREMIKGQMESIAPTEANAVAGATPVATEEKTNKKDTK